MAMKTVVAKGYTRTIRVGKRLVSQVLPDLKFKVCGFCGHWDGATAAKLHSCKCCLNGHKENPSG